MRINSLTDCTSLGCPILIGIGETGDFQGRTIIIGTDRIVGQDISRQRAINFRLAPIVIQRNGHIINDFNSKALADRHIRQVNRIAITIQNFHTVLHRPRQAERQILGVFPGTGWMINLVQQGNCICPVRIQRHGHDIVATGNTRQCIPTLGKHDWLTIGGQVGWARDGIIKIIVIQACRTSRSGGIRAKIDGIERMPGQAQASACRRRPRPIGPIAQIVFVQRYRIGRNDRIGYDGDRHIIGDINRQSLRNLLGRQTIGGILIIIRDIRNGISRRRTGHAEGQCLNILSISGFVVDLIQQFEGIAAIGIQRNREDITPARRRGQHIASRIIIGDRLPTGGKTRRTCNNPVHIVILQGRWRIIRRAIRTIINRDQIAATGQAHIATGCQAFLGRVGAIGQIVFIDRTGDSRTNGILIILNLGNIVDNGDAEFLRDSHPVQIANSILVIIGRR